MRNLCFGVLLAPYRLDYYNYIHNNMNCDIYFQLKGFKGQLFSTKELENKCTFKPKYLKISRIFGDRQIVWGLKKIIQHSNPQFIIVPEFSFLTIQIILIKFIFKFNFKIISQCDDSYEMLIGKGFSKVHSLSRKLCIKFIDDLILVDKRAKDWYKSKYQKGIWMPIIMNETNICANQYNYIKQLSAKIKETYELKQVKTLLFVGRLIEVKNLYRLLEACSLLKFPYKLFIIGEGDLKDDLMSFAQAKNINVTFLGRKNDNNLFAWYYSADVFILPSIIEAFGAVTNEALIYGCNCCISKFAGSACLIDEDQNGYLIDPTSVKDIADKITQATLLPQSQQRNSKMKYSFTELMENLKKQLLN